MHNFIKIFFMLLVTLFVTFTGSPSRLFLEGSLFLQMKRTFASQEGEIETVRQEMRNSPTDEHNIHKRLKVLQEWVRLLFQQGVDVSAVYPRGAGTEIWNLIGKKEIDKAAKLVDKYYRELETLVERPTTTPPRKAIGQAGAAKKGVPPPCVVNKEVPKDFEVDSHFGINEFYIPKMVARLLRLSTIQEVSQKLEIERVPKFLELGANWGRIHPNAFGSFSWENVDGNKDGKDLDFSHQDGYVKLAQRYKIRLLPALSPESDWLNNKHYVPENIEAYKSYVRQTVERYDGDGVNDMPGLQSPIKYWQLDNEADLRHRVRSRDKFENPKDYLEVLKATYKAVKEADTTALVMVNLAGLAQGFSGIDYIRELMERGAKDYFDIFSYHVYPNTYDPAIFQKYFKEVKQLIGDKPIWITETAIQSKPGGQFRGKASLEEQACWLIKNYIFHIANGVKKIFWLSPSDGSPKTPDYIAKYGGLTTFNGIKKPSYYTYRLMVSKLKGFNSVTTIQDGQYRFEFKNKEPVYIMWTDKEKTINMSSYLNSQEVLITYPIQKEGQSEPETKIVKTESIPLSEVPIFVE